MDYDKVYVGQSGTHSPDQI